MRLDVEPEFLHADGADAPSTSPMHRRYFGDASAMRLGPPTPSAQPPSWRPRDSCPPPQGEAGEEASSPGSSESSRGVGLPVGGAGVGGGEHCDPVVVGHCALRETTTAGAGAGSAGACAVLCSVVVRPELRSVRRGPLHTSRITEEVKVPISLPFARFSLCWASSEALVATVGFASKFLSGRTPGKVQGVAVPVPSGFPRIGCC
ncbi:unnamed protein product [Prorocentrum cordatum]|uniref:Uncharacterized protein n=1 Tax=Prorocentrum cordatum TaxID=2364126 RepID=A0ABN9X0F4_9DINO|nr:unnamed protein product [Polarella glacialis]